MSLAEAEYTYLKLLGILSWCNLAQDEVWVAWERIEEWNFVQKIGQPPPFLNQRLFYILMKVVD